MFFGYGDTVSEQVRRTDDAIANRERMDWERAHLPPLGDGQREAACAQQVAFKHRELVGFQCWLLKFAIEDYGRGGTEFTTDIVPDDRQPKPNKDKRSGISGNACRMLSHAHVIEPVYAAPGQIKRRCSKRTTRKQAWINVYKLCSYEVARTFLARNGWATEPRQRELAL